MINLLDRGQPHIIVEGVVPQPVHSIPHLLVVMPVLLQISLELLIVVLDDLQFFLREHFGNIVEVAFNTLDHSQYFLLQIFLALFGLL